MRAYVNELALAQACAAASPPHGPLQELLEARRRYEGLKRALFCARAMPQVEVRDGLSLGGVGRQLPRDDRNRLFGWTDKQGPFIDDDRQAVEPDAFWFGDDEVTEGGLGEAARRCLSSQPAAAFSPIHQTTSRFAENPLAVIHGLIPDEVIARVQVPNYVDAATLAEATQAAEPEPKTWTDALAQARQRFDRLLIGRHCDSTLSRHPFNLSQSRRVFQLLGVLQVIMQEMDDGGQLSDEGKLLRQEHFVGEEAWFSDESETRKRRKRSLERFTFPDPAGGESLTCFWHGKIGHGAFRMHFEWPPEKPAGRLRVVYIGPHLHL